MSLVQRQHDLEDLCARLREAPPIAFDTEFIRERRYWPQLCLVQVRSAEGVDALIDPFAVNLRPFLDLVADERVPKIVHSGSQDLEILFDTLGCASRAIFDTQIAAAFLGYGHQVGYAELVQRVLKGPSLSKGSQFSDWSARPLASQQVEYALADVLYLHPVYEVLRVELERRGRLHWAETEFRRMEERSREELPPDELYLKLTLSGLTRRQLGAARELAAARDELARSLDRPAVSVLPDVALLQLARHPPANLQAMRSLRGIPPSSLAHADTFLEALRRAGQMPPERLPQPPADERPDQRVRGVVALMNVVAQVRASDHDVSRSYLAPSEQLGSLAEWWLHHRENEPPPDLPLLADWRRELLGAELLDLLGGQVALSIDPAARHSRSPIIRSVPVK